MNTKKILTEFPNVTEGHPIELTVNQEQVVLSRNSKITFILQKKSDEGNKLHGLFITIFPDGAQSVMISPQQDQTFWEQVMNNIQQHQYIRLISKATVQKSENDKGDHPNSSSADASQSQKLDLKPENDKGDHPNSSSADASQSLLTSLLSNPTTMLISSICFRFFGFTKTSDAFAALARLDRTHNATLTEGNNDLLAPAPPSPVLPVQEPSPNTKENTEDEGNTVLIEAFRKGQNGMGLYKVAQQSQNPHLSNLARKADALQKQFDALPKQQQQDIIKSLGVGFSNTSLSIAHFCFGPGKDGTRLGKNKNWIEGITKLLDQCEATYNKIIEQTKQATGDVATMCTTITNKYKDILQGLRTNERTLELISKNLAIAAIQAETDFQNKLKEFIESSPPNQRIDIFNYCNSTLNDELNNSVQYERSFDPLLIKCPDTFAQKKMFTDVIFLLHRWRRLFRVLDPQKLSPLTRTELRTYMDQNNTSDFNPTSSSAALTWGSKPTNTIASLLFATADRMNDANTKKELVNAAIECLDATAISPITQLNRKERWYDYNRESSVIIQKAAEAIECRVSTENRTVGIYSGGVFAPSGGIHNQAHATMTRFVGASNNEIRIEMYNAGLGINGNQSARVFYVPTAQFHLFLKDYLTRSCTTSSETGTQYYDRIHALPIQYGGRQATIDELRTLFGPNFMITSPQISPNCSVRSVQEYVRGVLKQTLGPDRASTAYSKFWTTLGELFPQ